MNVGSALETLFYAFFITIGAAVILAIYVLWQTFFSLTPWNFKRWHGENCKRKEL